MTRLFHTQSGDRDGTTGGSKMALSKYLLPGSHHYRGYVGYGGSYDLVGALQFNVLTYVGLREKHSLLDIGCGSLRAGRLFIPYLKPGKYFGIDPNKWLIDDAIKYELGRDLIRIKRPTFSYDDNFTLTTFAKEFDYLLAASIFSHAPQKQIRRCLSEAKQVMKRNSIFVATYFEGKSSYTGDKWVYPGGVTYTPQHMMEMIGEHGLTFRRFDWPVPSSQVWILIYYPENAKNIPNADDEAKILNLRNRFRSRILSKFVQPLFLKSK